MMPMIQMTMMQSAIFSLTPEIMALLKKKEKEKGKKGGTGRENREQAKKEKGGNRGKFLFFPLSL